MKIEFDGWTVEDSDARVNVDAKDLSCIIGRGKLTSVGTPEQRAAYNHLEDTFAKTAGVTALDVAAELRRYLDTVVVGDYTVKGCQEGTGVDLLHGVHTYCLELGSWGKDTSVVAAVRAKYEAGMTVAEVGKLVEDASEAAKPKYLVVHGHTVHPDASVTVKSGAFYDPVRYKGPELKRYDPPLIWFLRENTSTEATQADVVAAINRYFAGPRVVGQYEVRESDWEGQVVVDGPIVKGGLVGGDGASRYSDDPAVMAAKAKFWETPTTVPEVAEFIENWKKDTWHDSTLRVSRDDKDNVVIPTPGGRFVRLDMTTGVARSYKTAEEAKK